MRYWLGGLKASYGARAPFVITELVYDSRAEALEAAKILKLRIKTEVLATSDTIPCPYSALIYCSARNGERVVARARPERSWVSRSNRELRDRLDDAAAVLLDNVVTSAHVSVPNVDRDLSA